ncbi:hypothetical protein [Fluviispira vulneris]|uniref:hypothetical protein n=1 Tax=Fluviispira vulneris TaxID=2763012 RepID=UPI00164912CF|nr:hypothetical protein [Fluviispira vulneris]
MLKKINKLVNIGLRLKAKLLILMLFIPYTSHAKNLNFVEISISKCKKLSIRNIIKIESKRTNIVYIKKDDIYNHLLLCGVSLGESQIKIWRADNWEEETIFVHVKPSRKSQANSTNSIYDKNYHKNEFLLEKKIAGWDLSNK